MNRRAEGGLIADALFLFFRNQSIQDVPHLVVLGPQIGRKRVLRLHLGGNALRHPDSRRFHCRHFLRVVGHEPNRPHSKLLEHLGWQFVGAAVGRVAQFQVCLDGIQPLVLKLVSAKLGHQPNSASLLLLIQQDPRSLRSNLAERQLQLQAAVAAQRSEDIPREALGVNPHQRRRRMHVPHHQRDQALDALSCPIRLAPARQHSLKPQNPKVSPAGREVCFRNLRHVLVRHDFIVMVG